MLEYLYTNYFAKDKPLRHYAHHLLIGILGFLLIYVLFSLPLTMLNLILFFLATYLIDLDLLISFFTTCKNIPEAKIIKDSLRFKKFYKTATLVTIYHKKFNKLLLHNVFGFLFIIIIFIIALLVKTNIFIALFGGISTHLFFDILDDVKQLGNINNWLWIYFLSRKKNSSYFS